MTSSVRRALVLASALIFVAATPAQTTAVNPKLPTLFVVGDLPEESLRGVFDAAHLNLQTSSAAGRTTRSYIHSGEWDKLLGQVKPGDFILIEFAPTAVPAADKAAASRTLQGIGDGTFDYLDPGTQKLELVHSYGWYLRRMVVDTINHGASPILCSPPASAQSPGSQRTLISPNTAEPADSQSTAAAWTSAIAMEQRVPFLDLSASGAAVSADSLRNGLEALQADPLGPYLQHPKP